MAEDVKFARHPPGTIIVPAGEYLRFGGFVHSLLAVQRPPETWINIHQSVDIVDNINECIRGMSEFSKWAWFQSDDHVFGEDTLIRLLDHEVDVIVPLMLRRAAPFTPLVFKDFDPETGSYMPFGYDEIPEKGLFEIRAAGSGGMLIRRHVLDEIGDPWFAYTAGPRLHEDFDFCERLVEMGVKIWCDPEITIGHKGSYTCWPSWDENTQRYAVAINFGKSSAGKPNTIVVHSEVSSPSEEASVA